MCDCNKTSYLVLNERNYISGEISEDWYVHFLYISIVCIQNIIKCEKWLPALMELKHFIAYNRNIIRNTSKLNSWEIFSMLLHYHLSHSMMHICSLILLPQPVSLSSTLRISVMHSLNETSLSDLQANVYKLLFTRINCALCVYKYCNIDYVYVI